MNLPQECASGYFLRAFQIAFLEDLDGSFGSLADSFTSHVVLVAVDQSQLVDYQRKKPVFLARPFNIGQRLQPSGCIDCYFRLVSFKPEPGGMRYELHNPFADHNDLIAIRQAANKRTL